MHVISNNCYFNLNIFIFLNKKKCDTLVLIFENKIILKWKIHASCSATLVMGLYYIL